MGLDGSKSITNKIIIKCRLVLTFLRGLVSCLEVSIKNNTKIIDDLKNNCLRFLYYNNDLKKTIDGYL